MRRRKARDSDAAKKVSQFWLSVVTSGKPAMLAVEARPPVFEAFCMVA